MDEKQKPSELAYLYDWARSKLAKPGPDIVELKIKRADLQRMCTELAWLDSYKLLLYIPP